PRQCLFCSRPVEYILLLVFLRPLLLPHFPYTTLFRSALFSGHGVGDGGELVDVKTTLGRNGDRRADGVRCGADLAVRRAGFEGVDRKSTRLNSSHVKISYAVFCLK